MAETVKVVSEFSQLKEKFLEKFTVKQDRNQVLIKLYACYQKAGESVDKYYEYLAKLMKESAPHSEDTMLAIFLKGLKKILGIKWRLLLLFHQSIHYRQQ